MDPTISTLSIRDIGTALLDLTMPRRCVVCRRPLGLRERFICLHCLADFPFTHFWERSHNPMADTFNALIQADLDAAAPSPPSLSPFPLTVAILARLGSSPRLVLPCGCAFLLFGILARLGSSPHLVLPLSSWAKRRIYPS